MNFKYENGQSFKEFFQQNENQCDELFQMQLHNSGIYEQLNESQYIRRTDFWNFYRTVGNFLIDEKADELEKVGLERGNLAAKNGLPPEAIMKLMRSFRKVFWEFLSRFYQEVGLNVEQVFRLQEKINFELDCFADAYFLGFLEYQKGLMISQREMINDMSVPIITLSERISILPLVGTMDTYRAKRIQEQVLQEIAAKKVQRMVIDLSGVAYMDTLVVSHLFRIVEGINLLGCHATVTGIRPEIANTIIQLGITVSDKVETKATLQQALEEDTQRAL